MSTILPWAPGAPGRDAIPRIRAAETSGFLTIPRHTPSAVPRAGSGVFWTRPGVRHDWSLTNVSTRGGLSGNQPEPDTSTAQAARGAVARHHDRRAPVDDRRQLCQPRPAAGHKALRRRDRCVGVLRPRVADPVMGCGRGLRAWIRRAATLSNRLPALDRWHYRCLLYTSPS